MSQASSLGTPISGGLNFTPGGNPYAGLAGGGLAGLGLSYGASYNSALQANQQNYNNILGGYQTVLNNVGNTLGQGGTPWGIAQPAATAIAQTQAQQTGGAIQNSINSGLGMTTAATAAQRGANYNAQQAYAGLGAQLAQTYAGYQANIGQGQLNFMNSVNIPYPNGAQYNQLYQQYGQAQQAQQALALEKQLGTQGIALGQAGSGNRGGGIVGASPSGGPSSPFSSSAGGGAPFPGYGGGGGSPYGNATGGRITSVLNPYGAGQGGGYGLSPTTPNGFGLGSEGPAGGDTGFNSIFPNSPDGPMDYGDLPYNAGPGGDVGGGDF